MNIDKASLKQFRVDFAEAVKELSEKYGVAIDLGNISYTADGFHSKMTVANGAAQGESKLVLDYKKYQKLRDLPDLNSPILINGTVHHICGFKPMATKQPVIVRGPQGGMYKISIETMRKGLGRVA